MIMETRLNPETTAISNDYTKKLREEVESNNKRIAELSVFVESLRAYEKETRILMERNTGLMTVINSVNYNIMKPVDEAALNAPKVSINVDGVFAMQSENRIPCLTVNNISGIGGTVGQIRSQ